MQALNDSFGDYSPANRLDLSQSCDDLVAGGRPANICESVVETGALPLVVHRGCAIAGDDHLEAAIGRMPGRVLDRHVGPCPGDNDGLSPQATQKRFEPGSEK